jgi:hypothetical protein
MAACTKFTCDECGFAVNCWDDGNRYLEWLPGTRNYLYHPGDRSKTEDLMLKIYGRQPTSEEYANAFRLYGGNENEFLCADCATISRIDRKRDPKVCKECNSTSLDDVSELAKAECPKCRSGHFNSGEFNGIS